jgi:hypothetical protein
VTFSVGFSFAAAMSRALAARARRGLRLAIVVAVVLTGLAAPPAAGAVAAGGTALFVQQSNDNTVPLGTAANFAVLAGSTITNTGPTTINGNLGLSPGTSVTGFPPGQVNGTIHAADSAALQAQADLTAAYNDAAAQPATATIPTELGGTTQTPGVYDSAAGTFGITGTLTLDAQGDPNAVFIFQAASTLITAAASNVNLVNGAQASNVFWVVGSSATLGTSSALQGSILALTSITVTTGATINGRALARNGAVTLDTDTITAPVGVLSITAPASASLGSAAPGGTASASLGIVQVTDNRDGLAGWTATTSATDFTTGGGTTAETIPAPDARYLISGFTSTTGSATFTPTPVTDLSGTAQPVVTATNVDGDNTAAWNPVIQVSVPSGAVGGTYSAIITHSVA